jgi:hypothetical protein
MAALYRPSLHQSWSPLRLNHLRHEVKINEMEMLLDLPLRTRLAWGWCRSHKIIGPSYRSIASSTTVRGGSSRVVGCRAVCWGYREWRTEPMPILRVGTAFDECAGCYIVGEASTAESPRPFVTIRGVGATHVVIVVHITIITRLRHNVQLVSRATVDVFKVLPWLARIVIGFGEGLICWRRGGGCPCWMAAHRRAVIGHKVHLLSWHFKHGAWFIVE